MPATNNVNRNLSLTEAWYERLQANLLENYNIDLNNENHWHKIQLATQHSSEAFNGQGLSNEERANLLFRQLDSTNGRVFVFDGGRPLQLKSEAFEPRIEEIPARPAEPVMPDDVHVPTRWERFANKITFGRAYRNNFERYGAFQETVRQHEGEVARYDTFMRAVRTASDQYQEDRVDAMDIRLREPIAVNQLTASMQADRENETRINNQRTRENENQINNENQMRRRGSL